MRPPATFVEVLQAHAALRAGQPAYTLLLEGAEGGVLTYEGLEVRARAIGAMLQGEGLQRRRVLLLYEPGLPFIEAFFGCLFAGAVAVPVYPPEPGLLTRNLPRFLTIIEDARIDAILTVESMLARLHATAAQLPGLPRIKWLTSEYVDDFLATMWRWPGIAGDSLAFLQYSSRASRLTARPVAHRDIVNHESLTMQACGHTPASRLAAWLPFYHEMGLIGDILQSAYAGSSCVLISPMEFLADPLVWLRTISASRVETSGAPNFAYELCVRALDSAAALDFDLRSWRVALNSSDPARPSTLRRFARAFAPFGFDEGAFARGAAVQGRALAGSRAPALEIPAPRTSASLAG
jgi:acyl-CoA synthetase (AMP-forming)/AMP-acid ligase II